MLSDAKIPIELYLRERLLLAGFAIDFAIVTLLKNSDVGKQVRGDYLETWSTIGQQNAAGAALYQLFVQRCSEYAMAVWALEAGKINTIGLTFWRFLASDNSRAMSLALTYAPSVYFSHFETAEKLCCGRQGSSSRVPTVDYGLSMGALVSGRADLRA